MSREHAETVRLSFRDWAFLLVFAVTHTIILVTMFWRTINTIDVQLAILHTNQTMLIEYMAEDRRKP